MESGTSDCRSVARGQSSALRHARRSRIGSRTYKIGAFGPGRRIRRDAFPQNIAAAAVRRGAVLPDGRHAVRMGRCGEFLRRRQGFPPRNPGNAAPDRRRLCRYPLRAEKVGVHSDKRNAAVRPEKRTAASFILGRGPHNPRDAHDAKLNFTLRINHIDY